MKKLLLLSALLIFACSSDDSSDNSSSELFRELYQGTSWYNDDTEFYYTFSPSRLLTTFDALGGDCIYWEEGEIDASEIDTDGCFYDVISHTVLLENREKFSFKVDYSDGVPVGGLGNCSGGFETLTFQIISENSIEMNDGFDVYMLTKTNNDFNFNNCVNGTLVGYPYPW